MTILSIYNKTDENSGRTTDILYMFNTIPIVLWICLLCSYLTFIAVLRLGHRLIDRRSRSDATWITTCAFLDQDNFPINRKYLLILSLFMSTGIFFAVSFLTNSVSTDLVVMETPIVIQSYDDILERNITGEYQYIHMRARPVYSVLKLHLQWHPVNLCRSEQNLWNRPKGAKSGKCFKIQKIYHWTTWGHRPLIVTFRKPW